MRIILGIILLFIILELLLYYLDGNNYISSIAQLMIYTKIVSNLSAIPFSMFTTARSFAPSTTPGTVRSTESQDGSTQTGNNFESDSRCELPQLDPWDRSIASLIDIKFNPMKYCKPKAEILTVLQNGTLKLTQKAVPNCDIVETQCSTSGRVTYKRMHHQIVPLPNKTAGKNVGEPFRPNVFIFLFDSVSRSSGIRSIPKTIKVLKEKYGAFDFHGLNKVGLNSLPNGYAFLTGIRIEELSLVDSHIDEKLPSERPNYCHKYLDNSTFIGRNFTSAGYVSLMAEDWTWGVFKVPGCIGCSKKPTTHYMRPFHVRMDEDKMLREQTLRHQCTETYQPLMEYHMEFLKAYPTSMPKFSLIWMSRLAHDSVSGLFHADDYFAKYFQENRPMLRDSFIFVMGDHGLRFGKIRQTKVGQIEDGNPMLFVAVPQSLTNNKQLMDNLRTNSADRLISQFDVFTTLLDIAAVAPRTNWTDFAAYNWSQKEGLHQRQSSFLRPLDPKRTCSFMHISDVYCICKKYEMRVSKDNQTVINAAMFLNMKLMQIIKERHSYNICADLTFKKVEKASIRKLKNKNGINYIYSITFVVSPSKGVFQGDVMQVKNGFRLVSSRISRLNAYGGNSHCTNDIVVRPICYCRDLL